MAAHVPPAVEQQEQPSGILTGPHRDVAGYFKVLSAAYSRQTGDATSQLVRQFLSKLFETTDAAIILSSEAVVHDNACGVGTASLAILSNVHRGRFAGRGDDAPTGIRGIRRIEATDSSPAMIDQLKAQIASVSSPSAQGSLRLINPTVEDSHSLPFPDSTFTLSVTNFSVTNFADTSKALREIHRTILPGGQDGLAVVSIWKRFTIAELVHRAQRAVQGDAATLMRIPQAEFFQDGYLRDRMVEAGFTDVQQHVEVTTIKEDAIPGLQDFITGDLTRVLRATWTEDDQSRWPNAVDQVLKEEIANAGGLVVEAWFVTGKK